MQDAHEAASQVTTAIAEAEAVHCDKDSDAIARLETEEDLARLRPE